MSERIAPGLFMREPRPVAGAASVVEPAAAPAVFPSLSELPRLLAAAPHRLMFFAGAAAVLLSMSWWTCYLVAAYTGRHFPAAPLPAGWAHAILTQYGMLSFFIFGFLLTVFPRWLAQQALSKRHYVPVFAGLFGGYLLAHAGLLDRNPLLHAGLLLMLTGWSIGVMTLARVLARSGWRDSHALLCFFALLLGAAGLAAFTAFAFGASWYFAFAAIKIGTFGLLLPIYLCVCHRMVPFFSANVVGADYRTFKPAWSLLLLATLSVAHLGLELTHRFDLLWLADVPMTIVLLGHWLAWQPWKCMQPGLLAVLYAAFLWLPVAFALFAVQSLVLDFNGAFVLGRAPVHALTVGYFGSMLVAMVTRVTHGHSGRPLQMGRIAWLTFALLQLVALTRVFAEVATNSAPWIVLAAGGWLIAFTPWVARSLWIYLAPRRDGLPG